MTYGYIADADVQEEVCLQLHIYDNDNDTYY